MKLIQVLFILSASVALAQDGERGFSSFVALAPGPDWSMFPMDGPSLPFAHSLVIDSAAPDGKSLYGYKDKSIVKVDLLSGSETVFFVGGAVPPIRAFAVSSTESAMFVVTSTSRHSYLDCGLYVISEPGGQPRTISQHHPCPLGDPALSISPDGKRVLLSAGLDVEVIDLLDCSIRKLRGYERAAWSPNGQSIAAFGNGRIALLDPITFKYRKSLGRAYVERPAWSPDSRYLLIADKSCFGYFFSLYVIDVSTGRRTQLKSSHCDIMTEGHFIISAEVYRKALENKLRSGEEKGKALPK